MTCDQCPNAKPLAFAVYCKVDPDVRDLPASIGYIVNTPIIQSTPPDWCPLRAESFRPAEQQTETAQNQGVSNNHSYVKGISQETRRFGSPPPLTTAGA
jgi:hypothetical protein